MKTYDDFGHPDFTAEAKLQEVVDYLVQCGFERNEVMKKFDDRYAAAEKEKAAAQAQAREARSMQNRVKGREHLINAICLYYLAAADKPLADDDVDALEKSIAEWENKIWTGAAAIVRLSEENKLEELDASSLLSLITTVCGADYKEVLQDALSAIKALEKESAESGCIAPSDAAKQDGYVTVTDTTKQRGKKPRTIKYKIDLNDPEYNKQIEQAVDPACQKQIEQFAKELVDWWEAWEDSQG